MPQDDRVQRDLLRAPGDVARAVARLERRPGRDVAFLAHEPAAGAVELDADLLGLAALARVVRRAELDDARLLLLGRDRDDGLERLLRRRHLHRASARLLGRRAGDGPDQRPVLLERRRDDEDRRQDVGLRGLDLALRVAGVATRAARAAHAAG